MNPELHRRLLEVDACGAWETPPAGFTPRPSWDEIDQCMVALESTLGCTLEDVGCIQDASHLCEFTTADASYSASGELVRPPSFWISFSAFDRMVTITNRDDWIFAPRIPAAIAELTSRGFNYISAADLDEPYDGILELGPGEWTWFSRFFDYH